MLSVIKRTHPAPSQLLHFTPMQRRTAAYRDRNTAKASNRKSCSPIAKGHRQSCAQLAAEHKAQQAELAGVSRPFGCEASLLRLLAAFSMPGEKAGETVQLEALVGLSDLVHVE